MQSQTITFYHPQSLTRIPKEYMLSALKSCGSFTVFLAFIDPRTDLFVDGSFEFYPVEQVSLSGRCFIAEYNGLPLRIPSDTSWWCRNSMNGTVGCHQKTAILKHGQYETIEFTIDVLPKIRTQKSPD